MTLFSVSLRDTSKCPSLITSDFFALRSLRRAVLAVFESWCWFAVVSLLCACPLFAVYATPTSRQTFSALFLLSIVSTSTADS